MYGLLLCYKKFLYHNNNRLPKEIVKIKKIKLVNLYKKIVNRLSSNYLANDDFRLFQETDRGNF